MKLGDLVKEIHIDPRKLTEYALNPEHPYGGHKAKIFKNRLGYTTVNFELLQAQIESQAMSCDAIASKRDKHGQRYTVDIVVQGAQGQKAVVRTGWLVAPDTNEAWLATLYVRREK